MIWSGRALSLGLLTVFVLGGALSLSAQDVPVQLTGRLESAALWSEEALPGGGQSLGLVTGWAGLTGGTRDVKSDLRLGFTSYPGPALSLQRAWTKFRFPGMRFTTGLGRLAWGPGFVLVPGDLLFDSVGTEVDFSADELRSQGAWLGDAWFALTEESFVEVAALQKAVGLRTSLEWSGVTLEAAAALDSAASVAKTALSTQFHAGLDWYATVRQDWPSGSVAGSVGAFGLWSLGEDLSITTRHEALVLGDQPWQSLRSYHDATFSWERWSVTGRVLVDRTPAPGTEPWLPSGEARWAPLQNLSVAVSAPLQPPWSARASVTAKW